MSAFTVRLTIAVLGFVSLAEVIRQIRYGMPFGPVFSVVWSVVAGMLLVRIARHNGDRWLRNYAWTLPPTALVSTIATFFAADGEHEVIAVGFTALILSLPLITVAITALRLNRAFAHRLTPMRVPAPFVAALAGLAAATPPAKDMVATIPVGAPHLEKTAAHAGCFAITTDKWSPSRQPGHAILSPTRFIRLDTVRGADAIGDRAGGAAFERGRPLIRPGWIVGAAYWEPLDDDRVVLTWNTGLHGTRVVLRRRGVGYRGPAISWTDVLDGSPSPRTTVSATPVSCDLVAPDSARMPGALQREMTRGPRR